MSWEDKSDYSYEQIDDFAQPQTKEQWLIEGIKNYTSKWYDEALQACEQAIQLDPRYARAHYGKALALIGLGKYEEAVTFCDKAFELTPKTAKTYASKKLLL